MKTNRLKTLALILAIFVQFAQSGNAGVTSEAVRDTVQLVLRRFGREAAEGSAETLSRQAAEAGAKYGEEGLVAFGKVGPRAFTKAIAEAGEQAPAVVKLTAKYGDEAVWVVSKPRGLAIFLKHGESAAAAVMKHPGIAEDAIERIGPSAAGALNSLSGPEARRLGMMIADGGITNSGESRRLLEVVAKYGDEGMDFIWKHKGALAVTAGLTAFVRDPGPFIDGTKNLAVEIAKPVGSEIAQRTDWTPLWLSAIAAGTLWLMFKAWIQRERTRGLK